MKPRTFACGFLCRRERTLPTWRGWLALVLVAGLAITFALRRACAFLTVHDPAPGGVLVVEGYLPPSAAREALDEFRKRPYTGLYVTGGPIEPESPLAVHGSYAALTADVLKRLGADPTKLHAVPGPAVARDRTYSTALALKNAMRESGVSLATITVMTSGPHSRRSRLLYEKAFGPGTRVGMIATQERGFDPDHWWRTSAGFRAVIDELVAYFYARLLFSAPEEKSP